MSGTSEPDKPKLPPGSPCTNCGRCCTNESYMGNLQATGADVRRWRRQGRYDILHFAEIMGPPQDPWADLWIDQSGDRERCPFVRKVRGQNRYMCTIYDTRPKVCRNYTPWAPTTICEVVWHEKGKSLPRPMVPIMCLD
jgi:Fe-S-cluster containining protein